MSLFDSVFGGRDAFLQIDAMRAIYQFCCVLAVLFLAYGFMNIIRDSQNPSRMVFHLITIVFCGYCMTVAPKYLEQYKNVTTRLQQENGFAPKYLWESASRIGEQALADYANSEDESSHWYDWANLAKKAEDGIMLVVMGIMTSILCVLMVFIKLILTIAQLFRDVIFYAACCLLPLAFGLIGGGFDRQKGVNLFFMVVSVASWPLAWLLVDAIVFLLLKPYDPNIGSSFIKNAEVLPALTIGAGIGGIVIVCFLYVKIALVILVGYMASVRICHIIFGGIGSGLMSMIAHAAGNMVMARTLVQGKVGQGTGSGQAGSQLFSQRSMDKSHNARGEQMAQGGPEPVLAREQQNHNNQSAGIVLSSAEYSQPEIPVATGNWRDDAANMSQYGADIRAWEQGGKMEYAEVQAKMEPSLSATSKPEGAGQPLSSFSSPAGPQGKQFSDSPGTPVFASNLPLPNQYVPAGAENEAGGTELQNV